MRKRIGQFMPTIISLATAYDDQSGSGDELVIPESFEGMEYADVQSLFESAVEQFDALHSAEGTRSAEELELLASLTEGLEAIASELSARDAEAAERDTAAQALAERVQSLRADTDTEETVETEEVAVEEGEEEEEEAPADDESAAQTITASAAARREVRVPLSSVARRQAPAPAAPAAPSMRDVTFSSGEGTGFAVGEGMDFMDIARAVDRKLQGYNAGIYENARKVGRVAREQHAIATFKREHGAELTISSSDQEHVNSVIRRAVDETRLPQGSLVASGGWCAPSQTLYDLLELESRDGLLSLPEVGVSRGGINFTPGPDFASIYSGFPGFHYSEQEDIYANYDGTFDPDEPDASGSKPCVVIDCPDFEDHRLGISGLCIQAGLLASRGYPELIARTIRGALIAHEHRVNGLQIQEIVTGSTAVNMAANQAGVAAPVLDAIEKQAEHVRYTHRLARTASLEAVFPFWLRGAIRADLSRRLGVDLFDVNDARIDGWFRSRGVNPQFVYNWQALEGTAAGSFTSWPANVSFLMYPAGTWLRGVSDIITLDTLYDSTLLGTNDYTALFTEEGWLVAKVGHDSRVVTTSICADGATHQGIAIECDGSAGDVAGSSEENPIFTSAVTAE